MVDGVSGTDLLALILDLEPEPERPPADDWHPSPIPSGLSLAGDALAGLARSRGGSGDPSPFTALGVSLLGVRTTGAMAPDIPMDHQRPAKFVFSGHVENKLAEIRTRTPSARRKVVAAE